MYGVVELCRTSASWEVRVLSQIVARDAQSVTGRNLLNIGLEYKLDPWSMPVERFKIEDVRKPPPTVDEWRFDLLQHLLTQRNDMQICGEDPEEIISLIDSLCRT